MTIDFPILIEPAQLEPQLVDPRIRIVALGRSETYAQGHIPGAVWMDYSSLVSGSQPAPGLMPDPQCFSQTLSLAGISTDTHVVAYDDEGSAQAGRLVWNLHVAGHTRASVLNGGIYAWVAENRPVTTEIQQFDPAGYGSVEYSGAPDATRDEILSAIGDEDVCLLDARTPEEFAGLSVRAARGGHIPGAVNLNWIDCIDRENNNRLLDDTALLDKLENLGITREREVIAYCQTHRRSAHSYVMLLHLGYPRVRAYSGAWSEWGNDPQTPIET